MRISDWSSDVCSSDLRDDAYEEFIDKCDDFEREVAKEVDASHFTYAELEENDVDLKKLQGWLTKIRKLDFYGAARAAEAEERIKGCEAVVDAYAKQGFEAQDENGSGSEKRDSRSTNKGEG